MQCPKCNFEQAAGNAECIRCGVIFAKYRHLTDQGGHARSPASQNEKPAAGIGQWVKTIFFYVEPETNSLVFAARAIVLLVLLIWGVKLMVTPLQTNYSGECFWHLVNLPFHEVGHLIFRIFGRLMSSLGGTLGQLLIPLICLGAFLLKTRDTFAGSFALWWFGENFMDLAPYINDARSLSLPLLGGNTGRTSPYGFHDWEFILKKTGLIRYDHLLADFSYRFGTILMIFALIWGGYILFKQLGNLRQSGWK
jgi:hypothetical protein